MRRATLRFLGLASLLVLPLLVAAGETFVFSADSVTSSLAQGKERTVLSGRAKVRSGSLTISADRIELSGKDYGILSCSGSVVAIDEEAGLRIETPSLVYDRKRKFSHMEGASILEDRKNHVVLKAQWIEDDGRAEVTVAEVNVRILKEDLSCRSEYAIYRRKDKSLELTGAPSARKDGDEYRATRIIIDIETEDVRLEGAVQGTIVSPGSPATEPAPPGDSGPSPGPAGDKP
jgi:lipopolysaccharide export system protein LptA